jgi:hypothetical protein
MNSKNRFTQAGTPLLLSFTVLVCISCSQELDSAEETATISQASTPTDETVSLTAVQLTSNGQVVDTLNGVNAIYKKDDNAPGDATYSCAAFVARYYRDTTRNVVMTGLFDGATPVVNWGTIERVTGAPHVGDIVRFSYGHWALVKSVSGSNVTLIEQNWKWSDATGKVFAAKNRVIRVTDQVLFRWKSSLWGDINSDGIVDIADAMVMAQYSVGLTDNANNLDYADVNRDGVVSVLDALVVANYTVGSIPSLPWSGPMP